MKEKSNVDLLNPHWLYATSFFLKLHCALCNLKKKKKPKFSILNLPYRYVNIFNARVPIIISQK